MTTTAAASTTSSVTPGRPSTTRVTILTGRRMTDLVLPAAAPIETYIDETVAVLAEILEDTPKDEFFSAPRSERAREFLARIIH